MKAASAKAKGRRAAAELRAALLEFAPELSPDDIVVTPSGVQGEDLWVSPRAQEIYPIGWECKNQEALNIWAALDQAAGHVEHDADRVPAVAFKRNKMQLHVALRLRDFLKLLRL